MDEQVAGRLTRVGAVESHISEARCGARGGVWVRDWVGKLLAVGAVLVGATPGVVTQAMGPQTDNTARESKPGAQAASTMTATSSHGFEVASIRPANRDDGRHFFGMRLTPSGRLVMSADHLTTLVWIAYVGTSSDGRVEGGPKWADSDDFDINAKVDEVDMAGWDKLTDAQRMDRVRPLLRNLLEERFKLKIHAEVRQTPVYTLVQAKGGTKLKEVPPPPANADPQDVDEWVRGTATPDGPPAGGSMLSDKGWVANAVTMQGIAGQLAYEVGATDKPVVDQTGLKGFYSFAVKLTHDENGVTVEQQVKEQMGLLVESRKVAMKTYVIDSAEKPSVDGS